MDLIYYPDSEPGIRRKRAGRGFSYVAADGTSIDDKAERARLASMAVPPAYRDVWMSPKANGHLWATGRDARKRKQYRYHPDWRAAREATKYDDLAAFGAALPRIRRKLRRQLSDAPGSETFAVAAVIALLDRTAMRVGNAFYAAENGTYGATTLRNRHITFDDQAIHLSYTGKGGKKITRVLKDKTLNRTFERLHDLPGAALITWLDDDDAPRAVTSDQVNAWLSETVEKEGITAKTFRTWAGSEAALDAVLSAQSPTIKSMAEAAAERLGNTPGIARNSYIHPAVIGLGEDEAERRKLSEAKTEEIAELRITERRLLALLGGG